MNQQQQLGDDVEWMEWSDGSRSAFVTMADGVTRLWLDDEPGGVDVGEPSGPSGGRVAGPRKVSGDRSIGEDGKTPAFRQAESRARQLVDEGRAASLSQALSLAFAENLGALYKQHVEQRRPRRSTNRQQALARAKGAR